uniref:Ubiquitin thioesterase OTU n=1 Tax=Trypanosoma congolense (strain IL3000) TaxID=1068625 RepID=G0UX64_TRYCI|nr:conserved hypothetical protein [Trypanosoma congolense IL3000]
MLRLRLRLPKKSNPVPVEVDEGTTWHVFLQTLSDLSGVEQYRLRILSGYPPQPITAESTAPVNTVVRNGDTLFVQEGEGHVVKGAIKGRYVPPVNDKWHFTRRICPADNSCLFHAAAYVLRNKSRVDGPKLRQECADVVEAHPNYFSENTILDRPNREYVQFIRNTNTWGGGIELAVLSFLTQTEIVALDLTSSTVLRFGEDSDYSVRAFVVYNGQHYDAIAMNPSYNSPLEDEDQVLFNIRDTEAYNRAKRFVVEEGKKVTERRE